MNMILRLFLFVLVGVTSLSAAEGPRRRPAREASDTDLNQAAAQAGVETNAFKRFARNSPHVHIDEAKRALVVCQALPSKDVVGPDNTPFTGTAPQPLSQTFLLHSRPGAQKVIYLDFKGHVTSGTIWNSSSATIVTPPFDLDGNPSAFSDAELTTIQDIWRRVAEDYAAWDIDVTTQDPGVEAIRRTSSADAAYGVRCVIGGSSSDWLGSPAGGVAYIGTFGGVVAASTSANDVPAFVFPAQLGGSSKAIAEAASHECGHTLGLYHDGTVASGTQAATEYYAGQGNWAPIMGVSYYKAVTQWSKGDYPLANNQQDQLTLISARVPLVAADHGTSALNATQIAGSSLTAGGIIRNANDSAWYAIQAGAGQVSLSALAANTGANLKIALSLLDSNGRVVASGVASGINGLNSSLAVTLATPGLYYIVLRGDADGTPATNYGNYASIGRYSLTGSWVPTSTPPPPPVYPPVASTQGTTPTTGVAPLAVSFSSARSTATNTGTMRYLWNFGDGTLTSDLANPTHTYATAGNYTATLTVVDGIGLSATTSVIINVTAGPTPPPATAYVAVSALTGNWYDLTGGRAVRRDADDDDDRRVRTTISRSALGYFGFVVTISDNAGKPVPGAIVSLSASGLVTGNVQVRTDRNGQAEVVTGRLPASTKGSMRLDVKNVQVVGKPYDPTKNALSSVTVTR